MLHRSGIGRRTSQSLQDRKRLRWWFMDDCNACLWCVPRLTIVCRRRIPLVVGHQPFGQVRTFKEIEAVGEQHCELIHGLLKVARSAASICSNVLIVPDSLEWVQDRHWIYGHVP